MATEGKLPLLGFTAGAVKFVALLGFSPRQATTEAAWLTDDAFLAADRDDIYFVTDADDVFFTATD